MNAKPKKTSPIKIKTRKSSGIQITDRLIRCVVLKKTKEGVFVDFFREVPLPDGAVINGEILKATIVTRKLRQLQKETKMNKTHLVIPYEQVEEFVLHVLKDDAEHIKELISSRLQLSNKIKEDSVDCEYFVREDEIVGHGFNVFVKCVAEDFLNSYTAIFDKAGMDIVSFNTSMNDIGEHLEGEHPRIILDFGDDKAHASIIYRNSPITLEQRETNYSKGISIIENFLNISKQEAEEIYRDYGLANTHHEKELLYKLIGHFSPLIDMLEEKQRNWYKTATKKHTNTKIRSVIVYGEKADMVGLSDYLSQMLKLRARHIDIEKDIRQIFSKIPVIHKDELNKFIPALYASLRSF